MEGRLRATPVEWKLTAAAQVASNDDADGDGDRRRHRYVFFFFLLWVWVMEAKGWGLAGLYEAGTGMVRDERKEVGGLGQGIWGCGLGFRFFGVGCDRDAEEGGLDLGLEFWVFGALGF